MWTYVYLQTAHYFFNHNISRDKIFALITVTPTNSLMLTFFSFFLSRRWRFRSSSSCCCFRIRSSRSDEKGTKMNYYCFPKKETRTYWGGKSLILKTLKKKKKSFLSLLLSLTLLWKAPRHFPLLQNFKSLLDLNAIQNFTTSNTALIFSDEFAIILSDVLCQHNDELFSNLLQILDTTRLDKIRHYISRGLYIYQIIYSIFILDNIFTKSTCLRDARSTRMDMPKALWSTR